MTPYDLVPSTIQILLWPMLEGIGLGLLIGSGITLAINAIDRFLARVNQPPSEPVLIGRYRPLPPRDGARPHLVARPELVPRTTLAKAT